MRTGRSARSPESRLQISGGLPIFSLSPSLHRVLEKGNRALTAHASAPPRFTGKQRMILLVLLGAGFMVSVDFSILNVALPETGTGVGMEVAEFPWITAAYALPSAGFALLFGRFADLFGRRRLFMSSMVLLTGASLLGGLASSPEALLAARALQGLATAMALPAAMSLLTTTFAEGRIRDRALGLNGALLSGGFTVGALVGGTLVSLLSWRAAFLINLPVTVLILLATPFVISESRLPERVKLDVPGAITVTGGLLAVVYAIIERSILAGVVGVVLLAAFWMIELRAVAPLTPVRTLGRPTVGWGNYAGLVVFAMETAMIFMMTLYLQNVLQLNPLVTGLIFGVPGLAAVFAGPVAGRFIGRFGYRKVLVAGMAVQGLATLPLIFVGPDRIGLAILIPALFIGFFGHVTSIVAYTITGTSGLPNEEQGLATGLTSMTQQVGVTIGIPILSAIAATQASELAGIHLALTVNVLVTFVSIGLVWIGLRPRAQQGAGAPAVPVATEACGRAGGVPPPGGPVRRDRCTRPDPTRPGRGHAAPPVAPRSGAPVRVRDDGGAAPDERGADVVTVEELVVEFALTRLDNPGLDLEEIAAMVVRRVGPDQVLEFASRNLAVRGELRGGAFESAVEYVLRTVLILRDGTGD